MFFTYLRREMRGRWKQACVVALGLGIGIGLVVTVSAASAGVRTAQSTVLHSLYGVGTDITVSQPASFTPGGGRQRFGSGGFAGGGTTGTRTVNQTRLAPPFGSGTIAASEVDKIVKLGGVEAASGGLALNQTHFSGTFTPGSFGGGGGGSPFTVTTTSILGVSPVSSSLGPLNSGELTSGRYFTSAENDSAVAIISSSYATQDNLKVGSTVTIASTKVPVVGIATLPSSGTTEVFLPIGEAQKLAKLSGKVTSIYVEATTSSEVSSVQSEITHLLPKATVTTSADLAKEVSGSISSAANLADNLGKWLAIVALLVAFLLAGLLSVAAVSRRVREFGTLKAIGWRTRRIVGQVMGEGMTEGLVGGVIGIGLGLLGAGLITALAPPLTATTGLVSGGGFGGFGGGGFTGGSFPGGGGGGGGGFTGGTFPGGAARPGFGASGLGGRGAQTVSVHLSAPIQVEVLALAVALAIAGGIIAGAFGSWRASRLRPADALRQVA